MHRLSLSHIGAWIEVEDTPHWKYPLSLTTMRGCSLKLWSVFLWEEVLPLFVYSGATFGWRFPYLYQPLYSDLLGAWFCAPGDGGQILSLSISSRWMCSAWPTTWPTIGNERAETMERKACLLLRSRNKKAPNVLESGTPRAGNQLVRMRSPVQIWVAAPKRNLEIVWFQGFSFDFGGFHTEKVFAYGRW